MKVASYSLMVLLSLNFLLMTRLSGQPLPDSTLAKINKLFARWDKQGSPGCAVAVVRNDSLIFSKGYGRANLEYSIPIEPTTIFHMASISKQFTAFAILLLAKQNKLKLDDDIRKYLNWFPDLNEKITIRHLLNHTGGVRDQWQLLATSGTRLSDVITQEHIVKILSRQQALNFKPGERYMYSNSGYTMLAEIVRSITGQTLRRFTDSAIFKPLGMLNTHFHDDAREIVTNRAYSYDRVDSDHYRNSILSYSNAGATSLFTNLEDMRKWIMNFYQHRVGDQADIDQLTKKGKLNDGSEIDYALGISTGIYNGWRQFSHSGGDAGFRTYLAVFPDLKMGFTIFSNVGDFNPGEKLYEVVNLLVPNKTNSTASGTPKTIDSTKADLQDTTEVKILLGRYISDDGLQINFRLVAKKFFADVFGQRFLLEKTGKNSFATFSDPNAKLEFRIAPGDTTAFLILPNREKHLLTKYTPRGAPPDEFLKAYAGSYYCPELECRYEIVLKDHQLVLTNNKYPDAPLTLIGTDHMTNDNWWMNHLVVLRDTKKQITGFEVNSGRVMHLRFNKIE
jgi:CubicO group peptidase (beta-lactamase class C family)